MRSFFFSAWRRSLLILVLPLAWAGAVSADEVTDWHEHMLVALRTAGVNPIVSSRNAALVSAAVFDAVNGVERRYAPIHVAAAAPRGASKRAAAVQAAYVILRTQFPPQADELGAKRTASLAAIGDEGESMRRGLQWGQSVADAILAWRSTDGFTPTPPPFLGGEETGRWRPTPPALASGAVPQFATMTPWGIVAPDQFLPPGPRALDSEEYAADYNETRLMGSSTSELRTADETDACFFWESGSPSHFWNRAALDLSALAGYELSDNAHLLATLNLSVADAIIACWNAKYFYQFWRPVTAIPLGDTDENDDTIADPEWTPLLTTPAHPEYTSGHSSASSAAATVLAAYFGDDTPVLMRSPAATGWVRFFPSFSAAIDDVADARVFAGIHFRTACRDGRTLGSEVADFIMENLMGRIHGQGE
jgi:PAP2 superfamily